METIVNVFLLLLGAYFAFGIVFGLYFFLAGAKRLDPIITDSKWTVRLLLVPGAIGLWVVLLPKILKANT